MDETATLRERDTPVHPLPVSETPPHTGTVVAACSAVFAAQLALVLPAAINGEMQRGLQTTGSELTWISAAFLVPIAMFSLSFGMLGDRFGRRKILSFGAAALSIGLLVSGISGSLHGLWVGQAIAGLGAAALFPTSLASITALTPGSKQRARGLAAWTTALSTGALAAPPLSAALTGWSGFRWAFLGAAALAALSLALTVALAHESRSPEPRQFDIPGQVTIAAGLLALLFGVIEAAERGFTAPLVVASFLVAVVLLTAFVIVELRAEHPLLQLSLFRIPAFAGAAVVSVIGMLGFLGGAYALSIRLGVIQHETVMRAAIPFVIIQAITPFVWPLLVRLLRRVGPRVMLVSGLVAIALADVWLVATPVSKTGIVPILGALVLDGLGFGLLVSALTAAAVNAVPVHMTGMASATSSMMRDLGQTLAPAIIGSIALTRAAHLATASLNAADLPPAVAGPAHAVLEAGGSLALASVPMGPQVAQIAQDALAHGFNLGFIVAAAACAVGAVIAAVFCKGGKNPATTLEVH